MNTTGRTSPAPRCACRLCRILAALTALCVLCSSAFLAGCGKEEEDWVTGAPIGGGQTAQDTPSQPNQTDHADPTAQPTPQQTAPSADAAGFEGTFDAPRFRSGTYTMVSTVINDETYTEPNGEVIYDGSLMTRYTYQLDITAGDEIVCRYTFRDIYGTSTVGSGTLVGVNTADSSLRDETTQVYYDLIGKSFTSRAAADGTLQSVSGIEEILSSVSGAEEIIDPELMTSLAADLFFPLPDKFESGTSWQLVQYGITNTCTVTRLVDDSFGVTIAGGEIPLAAPATDSDGFTTTYTEASPLSGTLLVDRTDRAVQELTSHQKTRGTLTDSGGSGCYFALTATTTCRITKDE